MCTILLDFNCDSPCAILFGHFVGKMLQGGFGWALGVIRVLQFKGVWGESTWTVGTLVVLWVLAGQG